MNATLFDPPNDNRNARPICHACGQKIRPLNPHRMDLAKLEVLKGIALLNAAGHSWAKLQRDHKLIDPDEPTLQTDDVHGLRLTWFGLAARMARRTGLYRVTTKGVMFLRGIARVPREILCKDGVVVSQSDDTVSVRDVRGVILDKAYWDSYSNLQIPSA